MLTGLTAGAAALLCILAESMLAKPRLNSAARKTVATNVLCRFAGNSDSWGIVEFHMCVLSNSYSRDSRKLCAPVENLSAS